MLQDAAAEMVVMCCRFLCYFCRTSRQNQRAMFEHLSYLLENSSMLLGQYKYFIIQHSNIANRISGVMVSLIALSVVGRGFKPWSGQTKDYEIGICYCSAMRAALKEKENTGWLGIRIMCPSGATCLSADCCITIKSN
jgi:hypothetical protein